MPETSALPPRVCLTRAAAGALASAERLRALGYAVELTPVLDIKHWNTDTIPAPEAIGLAVLTSQEGVRAFAERTIWRGEMICVGDATAACAQQLGFAPVLSAAGTALDLQSFLQRRLTAAPLAGLIVWAGAARPSVDLSVALAATGKPWCSVALYDSVVSAAGLASLERLLHVNTRSTRGAEMVESALAPLDAIVFHSREAALACAPVLAKLWLGLTVRPAFVGISEKAVAPLNALSEAKFFVAVAPNEQSVLAALQLAVKSP
jgi:uroporphyrinogen-III synthase